MAFPIGERGHNEWDTFHTRTFIIYTRIYNNYACMYRQIEAKVIPPTTSNVQSLNRVYLLDMAPQHAFKNKRKDLPIGREVGWTAWVFMTRDLEDRTGPVRP